MRRLSRPLISALAAALLLAGCSGTGSISIPTRLPSIALPSVDLPSIELPTIPRPGGTETVTETATPPAETVTETATRTVTATSDAVEPSPDASTDETDATSAPWWPWLLLLVLIVAAVVWLVVRRRRAQQVLDDWDARLTRARGEAAWVEQSLVPQVLGPTDPGRGVVGVGRRPGSAARHRRRPARTDGRRPRRGSGPHAPPSSRTGSPRSSSVVGADTAAGPDVDDR